MSVTRRPTLHPDEEPLAVETWELPRWDAQGEPVTPQKPALKPSEEDVEPDSVVLPTAEELKTLHEDAYNEGFESGYEQGLRQGQQDGQKQGYEAGYQSGETAGREAGDAAGREAALAEENTRIEQALKPLGQLLQGLNGYLTEQQSDLESGLIALALRLARQVIDAELVVAPEHIEHLVHAAVQALPNADERIRIELHPDDLSLLERTADSHWTLVANESLSRGGCLVKTRFSYVDYTLEHRYRQQVSHLLAHYGLSTHLQRLEQPWGLSDVGQPEPQAGDSVAPDENASPAGEATAPTQAPPSDPSSDAGASALHSPDMPEAQGTEAQVTEAQDTEASPDAAPEEVDDDEPR
ncbi:MAG: flagellar assembly protein FliH [Saccharospirillum sp.]